MLALWNNFVIKRCLLSEMAEIKIKLISLLDQARENVLTGTFDIQELIFLYDTLSDCFIEGRPDKGMLVGSSDFVDRQTLFYLFIGWWICYLKNIEDIM